MTNEQRKAIAGLSMKDAHAAYRMAVNNHDGLTLEGRALQEIIDALIDRIRGLEARRAMSIREEIDECSALLRARGINA